MNNVWGESPLYLGHQGENLARTKTADVSAFLAEWPDADFVLAVTLPGSVEVYIADVSVEGNTLSWPITDADTSYAGEGMVELRVYSGEAIIKGDICKTLVEPAMGTAVGPVPPAPPDWVTEILTAVEDSAESAASAAADAAAASTDASSARTQATNASASAADARQYAQTATQRAADASSAAGVAVTRVAAVEDALEDKAPAIMNTTESSAIASFPDGAAGLPMALTVGIEPVQAGSGDPSPTNVRPITGWTGCNVVRTGKNLWDEETQNGYFNDSGAFVVRNDIIGSKNAISVKAGATYYTTAPNGTFVTFWRSAVTKDNIPSGSFISRQQITNASAGKITPPAGCFYIHFNLPAAYGTTYNHNISINYPATDTTYHSSTGSTTLPVAFPSSAGTVYGGTLRIERDGSGTLTVTHGHMKIGNNFTHASDNVFAYTTSAPKKPISNVTAANIISSAFKTASQSTYVSFGAAIAVPSTADVIRINAPGYTTDEAFAAAFADVDIVYELATPLDPIPLTPGQVLSILGDNRVWADCGSTEAEYAADTKLYIDGKIAELQALILEN